MRLSASRLLLVAGAAQVAAGLALALSDAQDAGGGTGREIHAILLATGLTLAAQALALALLPAFTGREARPVVGGVALGAAILAPALIVPFGFLPWGFLSAPLLLAALGSAWPGAPVEGHVSPFEAIRPHRVGDRLALAAFLVGLAGAVAGAILLFVAPRGLPMAGLAVLLLAGALPLAAGVLAFLLPRATDRPLPGATRLAAALVVLPLAALALALAFAFLGLGGFRAAAAGVLLAHVLALAGFLRVKLPAAPTGPLAHARPLLRGAAALAPLAGLALLLALAADAPGPLLPLAFYAHAALGALLLAAASHLAAPFLGLRPGGRPLWSKIGAATLIAGPFLLAPAFQYDRPALPGAAVLALGGLLVAAPLLLRAPEAPRRRKR